MVVRGRLPRSGFVQSVFTVARNWCSRSSGIRIHATDCENGYGEFKRLGLTKAERTDLYITAQLHIRTRVECGFSVSINKADFQSVWEEPSDDAMYGLVLVEALGRIAAWQKQKNGDVPLTMLFERGAGYGQVVYEVAGYIHNQWPFLFADKRHMVQLQAADVLAYEGWKHWVNRLSRPDFDTRRSLESLANTPISAHYMDRDYIQEFHEDALKMEAFRWRKPKKIR